LQSRVKAATIAVASSRLKAATTVEKGNGHWLTSWMVKGNSSSGTTATE
jgi:hypothetical protein